VQHCDKPRLLDLSGLIPAVASVWVHARRHQHAVLLVEPQRLATSVKVVYERLRSIRFPDAQLAMS
jgi:hypothetical protein